jgi:SAM-dependent methyltransferase
MCPHTDWPGRERREPSRRSPTYAVRAPLATWLRAEAEQANGKSILDAGCGDKPYYPFFAERASEYVGVDANHPAADLHGSLESLPVKDASFDVVLCTQVLEHADDPAQVVRELRRVVKPGGRVLASTHGIQVYHPDPVDLWRWTHEGLRRLFAENAEWSSLTVTPSAGTTASVGMIVGLYVDLLARRVRLGPVGRRVVAALNATCASVDRLSPGLREPRPGTLFANYHVTAVA